MSSFVNEPLELSDLPKLTDHEFEPLDPNHLKVRWIGDGIFAAFVVVAALVAAFFVSWWIPLIVALALLALTAISAWLQRLEIDHLGYLIRDHDISYRSGVIGRSVETLPFARVQHVTIDRGPVERLFGLASLNLRSAGGGIEISGLAVDVAQQVKAVVVERADNLVRNEQSSGDQDVADGHDLASEHDLASDHDLSTVSSAGPASRPSDD